MDTVYIFLLNPHKFYKIKVQQKKIAKIFSYKKSSESQHVLIGALSDLWAYVAFL